MKMYVNEVMIRHWIGSDHDNKEAYLGLLVESDQSDIEDNQQFLETQ